MSAASHLRRITVDLTPVLPGGDNGGAKVLARTLVQELAELMNDTQFTLLTSPSSHAELADLDRSNVHRQCVDTDLGADVPTGGTVGATRTGARVLIDALVPARARGPVKDAVWRWLKRRRRAQVAKEMVADLHFAPFTAPFFYDPRVPQVAVVHDLQFLDHPEWFEPDVVASRRQHFLDACERADLLVCVSDFVRESVLRHVKLEPERVRTIHSTVLHAVTRDSDDEVVARDVLRRLGITKERYLLYPANPWPHKNHRRLIEAWCTYRSAGSDSDLALVCTGAPASGFAEVQRIANARLPSGSWGFAGFLDEREFAALLHSCRALIFPSLYEGFGLPVLEAMSCDRPVLCSDATSLPEVVGDAALLFDGCDTASIVHAIKRLEDEPDLEATLVERGRQRVARFGTSRDLAAKYLAAFENVVATRRSARERPDWPRASQ